MDHTLWKEFLEYARWAPSPHNVQPWKVKLLSDTQADLFYDPQRLLPDEDTEGTFLMSGLGVFVEALSVAANAKGHDVAVEYDGRPLDTHATGVTFLAHLSLVPATHKDTLDRELIKQRRTSRLQYKEKAIAPGVIAELQDVARQFGHTFTAASDTKTVDWVLRLNRDTMFYDMNDDKARNEVGHWIRYTPSEAAQKKDGLWAYCMNVASSTMYLFFHARWIINLPGIYQLAGRIYLRTTQGTPTVAWLQGPFRTPTDAFTSGRMLMRLWLTMTRHGIYLHPFGSIITNSTAHQRLRERFKVDESVNMLWLIVRMGYSDVPPRSYRLDLEDILIA